MSNITQRSNGDRVSLNRINKESERVVSDAFIIKVIGVIKNHFAEKFPELSFSTFGDGILIKAKEELLFEHREFFRSAASNSLGQFKLKHLSFANDEMLFTYIGTQKNRLRNWQSVEFAITMAKVLTQDEILRNLGDSQEAHNRIEELINSYFMAS